MQKRKTPADIFCKWQAKNGRYYTARLSGSNYKQVDAFHHVTPSGQYKRIKRIKALEEKTEFVIFKGTVKQFLKSKEKQ